MKGLARVLLRHFPWLGNATMAMDQSFDAYLSARTHREIDR
jgi:hypothetical protein